jgi:FMN phosphatase YigB (HAD superfamily)
VKADNEESAPECVKSAGAFIFDFDGTLYDPKHFARRLLFGGFPGSGKSGPGQNRLDQNRPGPLSLQEIRRIGAERKTRKAFSGCAYPSAETYYEHFFAALERRAPGFFAPPALCDGAVGGSGAGDGARQWYFGRYIPRMIAVLRHFYSPRPGAAEFFQILERRNIPRAVYSDYPRVRERLEAIGLDPGASGLLFGPENFGAQKPAPGPFLAIAAALGCEPGRILVIGDKDGADGAGARAAGMMYLRVQDRTFAELADTVKPGN